MPLAPYVSAAVLAALAGCTTGDDAILLSLQGRVQGYVDQAGISGAEITVLDDDGGTLGTASTASDGSFAVSVAVPYEDGVRIHGVVTHPAFVQTSFHQELRLLDPTSAAVRVIPGHVVDATSITLPSITLAPLSADPGSISGRIFDALVPDQTTGIGALSLELYEGVNSPREGTPLLQAITSGVGPQDDPSVGNYTFTNVPAGTYTVQILGGTSYTDAAFTAVSVGSFDSPGQNGGTTPRLADNQFRVILTWGESPSDLDTHLTGPDPSVAGDPVLGTDGRFHVFYSSKSAPVGAAPESATVFLDVDDTSSFGPETTTVRTMEPGIYRYSVHDYTNMASLSSTAMSFSRAKVQLFVGPTTFQSFDIPSGPAGTVWTVFDLDGETGDVYIVNEFGFAQTPTDPIFY
jgi:hypothetical protein